MDKCDEKCLRHDIEHLGSTEDSAENQQQTIEYSASLNVMNALGINIKPLDISRPCLNKNWRWQKHIKPPENSCNKKQENTSTNSTSKMHYRSSLNRNTKKSITCSSGSKRQTIYGGTLASTFSVFLIKCLIVATAYDDKFVNKL